jgi:tetratricopeptide (TPR) repeat protein
MGNTGAATNPSRRSQSVQQGLEALGKHAWSSAYLHLTTADREEPLDPAQLEGLAIAAHLLGKDHESGAFLARAHQGFLAAGELAAAARCALWTAFGLMTSGEGAQAGGWMARARRLLEEGCLDCVELGYVRLLEGFRTFRERDPAQARQAFVDATAIANRFQNRDLAALARQGEGRCLLHLGDIAQGVSLLDEAMVAVTAGEVSPSATGGVYCSVIEACREIFDIRRAQEWTTAMERWCAAQPETTPYRGHCMVHRAELLQLHGAWPDALVEARRACDKFAQPPPKPGAGGAFYRAAELHRVRGEFSQAEEAYRQANHFDPSPQPGFALLRLA